MRLISYSQLSLQFQLLKSQHSISNTTYMQHHTELGFLYFMSAIFLETYPLFLTGDKGLKPRRHSKAQLVYERRLILGVDLNFDPCFKRSLVCWQEQVRTLTTGMMICMHTLASMNWAQESFFFAGKNHSWEKLLIYSLTSTYNLAWTTNTVRSSRSWVKLECGVIQGLVEWWMTICVSRESYLLPRGKESEWIN